MCYTNTLMGTHMMASLKYCPMKNKFNYPDANLYDFANAMDNYGWVVYENVLSEDFVNEIINSLDYAYYVRRQIQIENGIDANMEGTLHHLIDRGNFAMKFLQQMYCDKEMKYFFSGNYLVNAFGGVMNSKGNRPYVQNIHRDIRTFTGGLKMMIQMIVLLDDFTEENGATYLLTGSHRQDVKPEAEEFYQKADRAIAKRGSILLFDSNLWHAAGVNNTDTQRRVLTLSFTKPYMKQQLDYPRFLGYEYGDALGEDLRQILGYNARVPANLHEFYQPPHKRMYQPGQG